MNWLTLTASFITGLGIGGVILAWVNWKIEKEKALRKRREELVADWRLLIADATKEGEGNQGVLDYLETQPAFYSLKPHLKIPLFSGTTSLRLEHTGAPESHLPEAINTLISEVARIEQEWKLI